MLKLFLATILAAAPLAALAQAPATSGIAQARAAGLVGERFDGYLGVANANADPLLAHQVSAINIRRRSLYSGLADSRHVSVEEVGITAACQLLATVGVGERFMLGDHVWRARVVGQEMLVPGYCR